MAEFSIPPFLNGSEVSVQFGPPFLPQVSLTDRLWLIREEFRQAIEDGKPTLALASAESVFSNADKLRSYLARADLAQMSQLIGFAVEYDRALRQHGLLSSADNHNTSGFSALLHASNPTDEALRLLLHAARFEYIADTSLRENTVQDATALCKALLSYKGSASSSNYISAGRKAIDCIHQALLDKGRGASLSSYLASMCRLSEHPTLFPIGTYAAIRAAHRALDEGTDPQIIMRRLDTLKLQLTKRHDTEIMPEYYTVRALACYKMGDLVEATCEFETAWKLTELVKDFQKVLYVACHYYEFLIAGEEFEAASKFATSVALRAHTNGKYDYFHDFIALHIEALEYSDSISTVSLHQDLLSSIRRHEQIDSEQYVSAASKYVYRLQVEGLDSDIVPFVFPLVGLFSQRAITGDSTSFHTLEISFEAALRTQDNRVAELFCNAILAVCDLPGGAFAGKSIEYHLKQVALLIELDRAPLTIVLAHRQALALMKDNRTEIASEYILFERALHFKLLPLEAVSEAKDELRKVSFFLRRDDIALPNPIVSNSIVLVFQKIATLVEHNSQAGSHIAKDLLQDRSHAMWQTVAALLKNEVLQKNNPILRSALILFETFNDYAAANSIKKDFAHVLDEDGFFPPSGSSC